jgi:hypothetical protein
MSPCLDSIMYLMGYSIWNELTRLCC